MAKDTKLEARRVIDDMSDEALGRWMRSLLWNQTDDALGRYFRSVLDEMSDDEILLAIERNQRAQHAASRPVAKA